MQIFVLQGAPLRGGREGQSDDILMSERERENEDEGRDEKFQEIRTYVAKNLYEEAPRRNSLARSSDPPLDAYRDKRIVYT